MPQCLLLRRPFEVKAVSFGTVRGREVRISGLSCTQVSRNIVMEAHLIRTAHFTGITCTAYQRRDTPAVNQGTEMPESVYEQQLRFRCSTGSHNTSLNDFPLKVRHRDPLVSFGSSANVCFTLTGVFFSFLSRQNSVALASVTLPDTLFPPDTPADCKLQFVAFRTGSFFPLSGNSSNTGEHARRRSVNTPVLFVGLGEEPLLCILATFNLFQMQTNKAEQSHIKRDLKSLLPLL